MNCLSNDIGRPQARSLRRTNLLLLSAATVLIAFASFTVSAQTKGAGSTLARDLMQRWVTDFGNQTVSYSAVGSSTGVKQASDRTAAFGVTDRPLAPVQLQQQSLKQIPLAAAGVAVVANIPGMGATSLLKLNGSLLADIYAGVVTTWDNPTIKSMNPEVSLPNLPIVPMWRSDGSGQTWAFTTYLSRYNGAWSRKYGADNKVAFAFGKGSVGGAALLAAVKSTPGAIGYDVLGEAVKSGLVVAQLQNAVSKFVSPSRASISETLVFARWTTESGAFVPPNSADLDASAGDNAWPITVVTYAVVPAEDKGNAMAFLAAAVMQGDKDAIAESFVPLPEAMKDVVRKTAASVGVATSEADATAVKKKKAAK